MNSSSSTLRPPTNPLCTKPIASSVSQATNTTSTQPRSAHAHTHTIHTPTKTYRGVLTRAALLHRPAVPDEELAIHRPGRCQGQVLGEAHSLHRVFMAWTGQPGTRGKTEVSLCRRGSRCKTCRLCSHEHVQTGRFRAPAVREGECRQCISTCHFEYMQQTDARYPVGMPRGADGSNGMVRKGHPSP